jgi:C-terminal processing protease CtpA/Prc
MVLLLIPWLAFGADARKATGKDEPVQMRPYNVSAPRADGFGISYSVKYLFWGAIDDAIFEEVDAGSQPAKLGIKSGDRIVTIDGKPVKGMKRKDFELLLFRNTAAMVLEIQSERAKDTRKVTMQFAAGSWEK